MVVLAGMPTCALKACGGGRMVRLLAVRAEHAHQALRQHRFERGGHQVGLDAHIHQAGQRAGRVVGVQRREDQVAGQRGLHGDLRGFLVANFADQNHVRVVAQNRAQPARKGQARPFRRPGSG